MRTCVLVLAVLSLVGCGGGIMPFTPPHSGSNGGTSTSGSGSGTSSSGTGSGTSGTGTSGTGSGSSGSGTSGSGTSGSGSSGSGSSGSGTSRTGPSEFTFGGYTWETHSGSAPPVGNTNGNVGTFDPMNVSVGSELVLSLTQIQSGSTILSSGSEV